MQDWRWNWAWGQWCGMRLRGLSMELYWQAFWQSLPLYSCLEIFNFPLKNAFQFVGTYQAAIPAMVYAVALTIIMGLTRQKVGGTWLNDMLSFWPFVLIYAYIDVILGVITLKRLYRIVNRQIVNGGTYLSY